MDAPVTLEEYANYGRPKGKGLSLHLGCGDYWFDGFINLDMNVYAGTDMIWDVRKGLPFQPETIVEIQAHDFLEHFNRNEVHDLLEDWKRVLIPDGLVVMSIPDMDGLIERYSIDKDNAIQQIYSIEDHPSHKWGYTVESFKKLFEDHGYHDVIVIQFEWKHRPNEPKLRAIARK